MVTPDDGSAPLQVLAAAVEEAVQEAPGSLEDQVRVMVPPGCTDAGVAVSVTVGPTPPPPEAPLLEAPLDDPLLPGPPLAEQPASASNSRPAATPDDFLIGLFMRCLS